MNLGIAFKADKIPACLDSGDGGGAAPGANVRYQFSRLGIGFDQVLAQRHGLLGRVDIGSVPRKEQQIIGKTSSIGFSDFPYKFPVVGTEPLVI